MVRRRTRAVGATLHLDHRPDVLERLLRLLRLTNVLEHLTVPVTGEETRDGHPRTERCDG
ncbi:hypothetical protein [Streptomyces sp. NPDC047841]|uniref:hypothetical protein n=1 Tax=Streptomyces sp. NPDC047841 TaxID=3154708 RepID=UPI003452F2CC